MFLLPEEKRSVGLGCRKEQLPPGKYLDFGMTRKCRFHNLKFLPGMYGLINSEIY